MPLMSYRVMWTTSSTSSYPSSTNVERYAWRSSCCRNFSNTMSTVIGVVRTYVWLMGMSVSVSVSVSVRASVCACTCEIVCMCMCACACMWAVAALKKRRNESGETTDSVWLSKIYRARKKGRKHKNLHYPAGSCKWCIAWGWEPSRSNHPEDKCIYIPNGPLHKKLGGTHTHTHTHTHTGWGCRYIIKKGGNAKFSFLWMVVLSLGFFFIIRHIN